MFLDVPFGHRRVLHSPFMRVLFKERREMWGRKDSQVGSLKMYLWIEEGLWIVRRFQKGSAERLQRCGSVQNTRPPPALSPQI